MCQWKSKLLKMMQLYNKLITKKLFKIQLNIIWLKNLINIKISYLKYCVEKLCNVTEKKIIQTLTFSCQIKKKCSPYIKKNKKKKPTADPIKKGKKKIKQRPPTLSPLKVQPLFPKTPHKKKEPHPITTVKKKKKT